MSIHLYNKEEFKKFTTPIGTALDRFIAEHQEQFPYATGELSQLLRDIALASKIINREINRAGLSGVEGTIGMQKNIQHEDQQKLDVIADVRFTRALTRGGQTCAIVSEEVEEVISTNNNSAKYIVAIDPLDGSSNIDVNVSIGTIFSIYRRKSGIGSAVTQEDILQKGNEQIAAGYVLYGSSTILVYSTGFGVNGFTHEPSLGEYFLSHSHMKINPEGNIYSINEGNYEVFPESIKKFLSVAKRKQMMARYIGSLVADFHRNMLKGGIYIYPPTKKHPNGKLRLLYECNALAFLVEQAGGMAIESTGSRILDILPHSLHQRSSLYIGSSNLVKEIRELI